MIEENRNKELLMNMNIDKNYSNDNQNFSEYEEEIINFGDLEEGDIVMGPDGPVMVTRIHEKHIPEKMFEIELDTDDGKENSIKVSGSHLFYIVSSLDNEMHYSRIRKARKFLKKNLDKGSKDLLKEMAEDSPVRTEVSISNICRIISSDLKDNELHGHMFRIAESLGPIIEDTYSSEDFEDATVPKYDGQLFSRQILALAGIRPYSSKDVIVGRVVTAQEIFDDYSDIELPEVKDLKKNLNKN